MPKPINQLKPFALLFYALKFWIKITQKLKIYKKTIPRNLLMWYWQRIFNEKSVLQSKFGSFFISFLSFLTMYNRESIVFGSHFGNGDFDGFTWFEVLWIIIIIIIIKHIFNGWFVYVTVISKTQKQIVTETSNLIFCIFIIHRCYLKLSIKIGQKLRVHEQTKKFLYIKA